MSPGKKLSILFHTVIYLKPIQVYARALLYVKKIIPYRTNRYHHIELTTHHLRFCDSIPFPNSNDNNSFEFLNLKKEFNESIDWNYLGYGRLWTYNLNYFEYLDQENMTPEHGVNLIESFIQQLSVCKVGLEPYPLSLRCFNWIRFFLRHDIHDSEYNLVLYRQLNLLTHKLEYHLLGNHLLENSFALLFGAYYFNDSKLYNKAKKILIPQLKEQILPDGAHFELSHMYHCTMLFRLLDCYNLVSNNTLLGYELVSVLKEKIEMMLSWNKRMTFRNGNITLMNDAAFRIAPTPIQLNDYALRLELKTNKEIILNESGYRKLSTTKFELVADIGIIGPSYQPGHAHADTFSFELYINGRPVIVDTGTSTYEVNATRFYERSTMAHNTVVVQNMNSSQVWGGHRVAKRAKVKIINDFPDLITASHNGYQTIGQIHTRTFQNSGDSIILIDELDQEGIFYMHFEPSEEIKIVDQTIVGKDYCITFLGAESIVCVNALYSPEFNKRIKSQNIQIEFKKKLETHFK